MPSWILLFTGFIISFLITLYIIPILIFLAKTKGLFDVPNQRKIHEQPISSLGGIAFFITFWLVLFSISDWEHLFELRLILIGSFVLFLVSLNDDLIGISPIKRLIVQFFVGILCFASGFQVEGFYGLFNLWDLPIWLTFPITLLTVGLIINAYNLIDGINGLAGSLGIMAMFIFGGLFYLQGDLQWCLTAMLIAGSIAGFLKYNFGKATIFMGDNGSTFIGLMVAVFFIKFINTDYNVIQDNTRLITGLSILFIPVFDLIRVFFIRITNGQSPLTSDKSHLHHFLLSTSH